MKQAVVRALTVVQDALGSKSSACVIPDGYPVVVVPVLLAFWLAAGQMPMRQTEVIVPGTGVTLNAGWQLFIERGCRFAVPIGWHVAADGSIATAPNGSTVSVTPVHVSNWPAHKAQMLRALGHVTAVHDDSARRLWIEFADEARREHYVAVAGGALECVGVVELRDTTPNPEETARIIADSIGPAPDNWPPSPR